MAKQPFIFVIVNRFAAGGCLNTLYRFKNRNQGWPNNPRH
jgi:hypothetical protein